MQANKVISGTWGELWLDGAYVGECYGLQAKVTYNKEDVPLCRQMATDKKVTSISCTGSVKSYKINNRMAIISGDKIKNGQDIRFTLVSKLADPDSYGAERISLSNVSFDDLTLTDWEVGKTGKIESPFTFTDYTFLDKIEA